MTGKLYIWKVTITVCMKMLNGYLLLKYFSTALSRRCMFLAWIKECKMSCKNAYSVVHVCSAFRDQSDESVWLYMQPGGRCL